MATRQRNEEGGQKSQGAAPRQPRKMRVSEEGQAEEGGRIKAGRRQPEGGHPSAGEAVREMEREEYRHGGTPIGSDPRE